jgi:hypothetical protein
MKSYLPSLLPQQALTQVKLTRLITYGQLLLDKDFSLSQAVSNALGRSHRKANE